MVRLAAAAAKVGAGRAALCGLLLALGGSGACTTNHDALARQPPAGGSGGAGTGGSAGFATGGLGNTGNDSQGGRMNPDQELLGDNVLTIVNGVVDAPSVRLCFARVADTGESTLAGDPLPELGYGASKVLTALDGFSFVDDVLQPWVIAGELGLVEGLDCQAAVELAQQEEAKVTPVAGDEPMATDGGAGARSTAGAPSTDVAGPGGAGGAGGVTQPALAMPALRARALAALPAGSVNIGRSILLVLTGCMGGAAYRDHIDTAVCGDDYRPDAPTLQPVVVKLSRALRFDKVGLQAVQASLTAGTLDVRGSGEKGAVSLPFASSVGFGAIVPRPANTSFGPDELGVQKSNFGLQALNQTGKVLYQTAWSKVLERAGFDTIVAARTYTAIFIGPSPLITKPGWWNASAFALVDNDPTRKD